MIAEYQIEVINNFSALQQALGHLNNTLLNDPFLICWMATIGPPNPRFHTQALLHALNQLEYTDDQDPREIAIHPGLVGVSAETLHAVEHVNLCKQKFKQAILNLKRLKISFQEPTLKEFFQIALNTRPYQISASLKRSGLSRLHLKQCYRIIPILKKYPHKVSWTWANTRSIKKISISQAAALLNKRGNDYGIQQQLVKLSQINPNEKIAIVQNLAPHLRANIVFKTAEQIERQMIKGPLPIFFPLAHETTLPLFTPPKNKAGKDAERLLRCDTKIDPELFLPAIRGYRYLDPK